jgi:hypothetical protein
LTPPATPSPKPSRPSMPPGSSAPRPGGTVRDPGRRTNVLPRHVLGADAVEVRVRHRGSGERRMAWGRRWGAELTSTAPRRGESVRPAERGSWLPRAGCHIRAMREPLPVPARRSRISFDSQPLAAHRHAAAHEQMAMGEGLTAGTPRSLAGSLGRRQPCRLLSCQRRGRSAGIGCLSRCGAPA